MIRKYVFALAFCTASAASGGMIKCLDKNGQTIYTDKKFLCRSTEDTEQVELKDINTHSDFGAVESKEFYNYANRSYVTLEDYRWKTVVEKELFDKDPRLAE
jgi:hypothetical protein